jgi:hypothetical protein
MAQSMVIDFRDTLGKIRLVRKSLILLGKFVFVIRVN